MEVELGEEMFSEFEEGNKLDEILWKIVDRIIKEELEMVGSGKWKYKIMKLGIMKLGKKKVNKKL